MEAAVRALFDRYESLFNRTLAGEAGMDEGAALYAPEFIAATPAGVMTGKNDEGLKRAMAQEYARNRKIGTKGMRIRGIRLSPLDEFHCVAHVAWTANYTKDGKEIAIDFEVHYLVQKLGAETKVFGWVSGDEEAVLRERGGCVTNWLRLGIKPIQSVNAGIGFPGNHSFDLGGVQCANSICDLLRGVLIGKRSDCAHLLDRESALSSADLFYCPVIVAPTLCDPRSSKALAGVILKPLPDDPLALIRHRYDPLADHPLLPHVSKAGFSAGYHVQAALIVPVAFDQELFGGVERLEVGGGAHDFMMYVCNPAFCKLFTPAAIE